MPKGFEILHDDLDEDYQPSEEEIEAYARYLGMDLVNERHFFYIAEVGLMMPLPSPWKPCVDSDNEIWYYNTDTKELNKYNPNDLYLHQLYLDEKSKLANLKRGSIPKMRRKATSLSQNMGKLVNDNQPEIFDSSNSSDFEQIENSDNDKDDTFYLALI